MRISELLKQEKATFSMEVFPPKTSEKFTETAENAHHRIGRLVFHFHFPAAIGAVFQHPGIINLQVRTAI